MLFRSPIPIFQIHQRSLLNHVQRSTKGTLVVTADSCKGLWYAKMIHNPWILETVWKYWKILPPIGWPGFGYKRQSVQMFICSCEIPNIYSECQGYVISYVCTRFWTDIVRSQAASLKVLLTVDSTINCHTLYSMWDKIQHVCLRTLHYTWCNCVIICKAKCCIMTTQRIKRLLRKIGNTQRVYMANCGLW